MFFWVLAALTFFDLPAVSGKPVQTNDITVLHDLAYRPGQSKQWRLDLAYHNSTEGPARPAIVVIHGGGWIEGDKSSFASKEHGVPGNIVDFAALGFVALTINYRLAAEAPYPAALEDCQCAIRWLRAHSRDYPPKAHAATPIAKPRPCIRFRATSHPCC